MLHLVLAAALSPQPFDACKAVSATTASQLIGAPVESGAPSYRQNQTTPRQQSLCVYNAANSGQLSVLLLSFGTSPKDREAQATFRSTFERAARGMYGKPVTTVDGDTTLVSFYGVKGQVVDVAAFTPTSVARMTLVFGKARPSALDALVLSLARTAYAMPPATATPLPQPVLSCGD